MSECLEERERLWEHELQVRVSTGFLSSPKLSQVYSSIERQKHGEHVFYFFKKILQRKKEIKLVCFDRQNVNSFSFHHYINSSFYSSVFLSSYRLKHDFKAISVRICLGLFSKIVLKVKSFEDHTSCLNNVVESKGLTLLLF